PMAKVNRATNSHELLNAPWLRAAVVARLKAAPQPYIAIAAMVGLPMRLVQRFEVRKEPTAASAAAAIVAAAGPWTSSNRKMNSSAPASEVLVPGMRTGKSPLSAAIAAPQATSSRVLWSRWDRSSRARTSAATPTRVVVHQ